ncbi:MAG: FAD-binding oxidoreductase [Acidaminococcaceae bacterium]|nr:FAD-binding oxidoreductase [Acidaminococcaceae bacterium]
MSFQSLTPEVLAQLNAALPGSVLSGDQLTEDYAHDEMISAGFRMPDAVVLAQSTEDVSKACKILYENNIPIIPRGAGTGLSGGCAPICGGVVIDLTKMNHILRWDLENGLVHIEAGVLLADLTAACLERDMFYPPDPGQRFAAVGGNVATNAGGMRAVKYGCTREYVRTLKVVLPDGRVVKLGGEPSKNSSGYSLLHLMVGSEGTLGIITEIGLKLIPKPKFQVSLLGMFEDLEACIRCVPAVKGSGLDPQSLEFMPRSGVVRAEKFMEKTVYPAKSEGTDVGAYLLTTFDCRREEEMDEIMEAAAEVMLEGGALDVLVFDNPNSMKAAWDVRRAVPESILETYDKVEECDIVVPTSYIAEVVDYALSLTEEVGLDIHTYGHAGDGNIHIKLCANGMEEQEFRARSDKFLDLIYARGKGMNALISGEHGIGAVSVRRLEDYAGKDVMDLMRGIKAVFDPKGLLNPGKVCTYVKD